MLRKEEAKSITRNVEHALLPNGPRDTATFLIYKDETATNNKSHRDGGCRTGIAGNAVFFIRNAERVPPMSTGPSGMWEWPAVLEGFGLAELAPWHGVAAALCHPFGHSSFYSGSRVAFGRL